MSETILKTGIPEFLPAGSFARYAELDWDRSAYNDVNEEGRRRKIIRTISRTDKSPISILHNFQIGTINSSSGNGPTLHAHDYPEIFIPVQSGYRIDYGPRGQHSAELGLYDTYSIPLNVMRQFEALESFPNESQMVSIFDTSRQDAREGITITSEIAALDKEHGHDQGYLINDASDDVSPEVVQERHIARFKDLQVLDKQGMKIRHVISSLNFYAALREKHSIEVDFLELAAGTSSQTYESNCREVFVALEGEPVMKWNGKSLCLNRLDMMSVAANDLRQVQAKPNVSALLLRIRDITNP
jgi:mannose-6-phosphate isomerase-like protein (cupin superfamily)